MHRSPEAGAPRVLHVAQPTTGGVARYLTAAVEDQCRRGWEVGVACPPDGDLAGRVAAAGAVVHPWPARRAPGPGVPGEVLRLRRAVAAFRPHVVHLHSAKAGLAGRLAVRRRIPTVFQPHGWSWLAVTGPVAALTARWERAAVRWTDLVVCVGDGEADQAAAAGVAGRVAVVRNGVDLRRFRPATPEERGSVREAAGWGPDVPVAVCVGRVARQKGQDVLLRAWPQVLRSCPDAELVLVGGGEEELDLPGPPRVRAVGAVDDVRPWLSAADVVVFPSRWEGLSLGLLEAMAVGRSTVVSAIPGLVEVVDGSTGAAVPADDAAALAAAVVERLRSPELRASEGAAAAARAREEFSERATFDRLAVLTSALATGAVR